MKNRPWLVFLLLLISASHVTTAKADPTLQGPSGYINVPAATTIKQGQVEFSEHAKFYEIRNTRSDGIYHYLTLGFSPIRDLEVGVQKIANSRTGASDLDPDPTVNFKVRLPRMGRAELSETALGMVLDTNPNNYHTLYFTIGGFGVAWNLGGNPGIGTAQYGTWNRNKKAPTTVCLIAGGELTPGKPGERGYRTHCYLDYNGDIFSLAWRYKSHRGFFIDAGVHTATSYDVERKYQPLFLGCGGIF